MNRINALKKAAQKVGAKTTPSAEENHSEDGGMEELNFSDSPKLRSVKFENTNDSTENSGRNFSPSQSLERNITTMNQSSSQTQNLPEIMHEEKNTVCIDSEKNKVSITNLKAEIWNLKQKIGTEGTDPEEIKMHFAALKLLMDTMKMQIDVSKHWDIPMSSKDL